MVELNTDDSKAIISFEKEYSEACRNLDIYPFSVLKFGNKLPPLPFHRNDNALDKTSPSTSRKGSDSEVKTSNTAVNRAESMMTVVANKVTVNGRQSVNRTDSTNCLANKAPPLVSRKIVERRDGAIQEFLKRSQIDSSVTNLLQRTQTLKNINSYESRYHFKPTICLELGATDEDEDNITKLQVRGWHLETQHVEAIITAAQSLTSLSSVVFWNNGFSAATHKSLANYVATSNIRKLFLDNNPKIPESCFTILLGEDSCLRILSLRGNNIGDVSANSIATNLKNNHSLISLDLFDNSLGKLAAEVIGNSLQTNSTLQMLNLGKNRLADEGIIALAKSLANIQLTEEEVLQRRKETEKLKQDVAEEDQSNKKKSSNQGKGNSGAIKQDDKKKKPPTKKDTKPAKTPEDKLKKNASKENLDDKKGRGKIPDTSVKSKKTQKEESKDEVEELPTEIYSDQIFEINHQWFTLGNRSLNSLNLSANGITESGLASFVDLVEEQEITSEHNPEGLIGLFRVNLRQNLIADDSPNLHYINAVMQQRNPFYNPAEDNMAGMAGEKELNVAENPATDASVVLPEETN